jgi:hypothetical protein
MGRKVKYSKELKINNIKSASKNEGPDIDFDDENDDGVTWLSLWMED